MKTCIENARFLSWRIFFVGKYGIQSTNEMAFKRIVTLRASFRFPAIRFDAPTLLSFSGFTHAHAKCPPVTWHVISIISENNPHYYINTNEMPGELSRENLIFTCENNMLSSHVKISPLLWLHNKSRLSHQKNYWSEMVWYFIGVYIINSKKFILVKQQLCSCTTLFCTFFSNPSSTTTWHFLFSRPRFTESVKETQKVSVFFF